MTTDKEQRAAFEAWKMKEGTPKSFLAPINGVYEWPNIQKDWLTWQAAQAQQAERLRVAELDAARWKGLHISATNHWLYERGNGGCEPDAEQIAWADALRKDAARYQWLRHGDNDEKVLQNGPVAKDYWYLPRNGKLDEMIDVAIAQEQSK